MKLKSVLKVITVSIACTMSTACGGGPLSHMVDLADVPAAKHSLLKDEQRDVAETQAQRDKLVQRAYEAEAKVKVAEQIVETAEHDVEIAEAGLELEETKASAGRAQAVSDAKATLYAKRHSLEVAEAKFAVAEAGKSYDDALVDEAEKQWLVDMAKLELSKVQLVGAETNEQQARVADFEKQLADQQADLAKAKRRALEKKQKLEEKESRLASLSS